MDCVSVRAKGANVNGLTISGAGTLSLPNANLTPAGVASYSGTTTVNGNVSAASGTPLTAYVSGNLSNTGGIGALGSLRAEATGLPVTGGNFPYFNQLAFTTPPAGEFGNAGKDTIAGPGQFSLNASLNRAFRFGESRRQLQLRLSANNVLNHVYITGFGTTVNSQTYGLPTAAAATRNVSLLLRFNF